MISDIKGNNYLFTLRIWAEPQEGAQVEWRGKLQVLPGGEAYFFRSWPGLIERLETMLGSVEIVEVRSPIEE